MSALHRQIFAACRELGIDNDARRDLQLRVTGKASLSAMSEPEKRKVIADLKAKGFAPKARRGKHGFPKAERADTRLIFVLWRALADAGEVEDGSNRALNAFIARRFGAAWGYVPVDANTLNEADKIADVIEALKHWIKRSDVDFDWGRAGQ